MDPSIRSRAVRKAMQWRARWGSMSEPAGPPPSLERRPEEPFADYWRRRIDQHHGDGWAGVPLAKLPEDLRVYQHLLWESRADTVIELGAKWGGSLLWFRDQLRTFAGYGRLRGEPKVIGVDLATEHAVTLLDRADPGWRQAIVLVEGDLRDAATLRRVDAEVDPLARCLVVEDAAHTGAVTRAGLDGFSHLVPKGGFYVVEDGHVDLERLHPDGPPEIRQLGVTAGGVRAAIFEWLKTPAGREFEPRPDLELYGLTTNPGGYLQRRIAPA